MLTNLQLEGLVKAGAFDEIEKIEKNYFFLFQKLFKL